LNLNDEVRIPAVVTFGFVEQEAVLLNKQTNQYFMLDEVGARLWALLQDGKSPGESCHELLEEYEVDPVQLECDLLELLDDLEKHGLVEIIHK
jgi:hypothetical protein